MRAHTCPVCSGQGEVSRPPDIGGDVIGWMTTNPGELFQCLACKGSGVVWEPTNRGNGTTIKGEVMANTIVYEVRSEVGSVFFQNIADAKRYCHEVIAARSAPFNNDGPVAFVFPRMVLDHCPDNTLKNETAIAS